MKTIGILFIFLCSFVYTKAQCIDVIITSSNDTIFGRLLDTSNNIYTFDSYNYVFAIHKDMTKQFIPCFRQSTKDDFLKFKQLDNLSEGDLFKYTSGYYLRKSTINFYLGICLLTGGLTTNTLSFTYFNDYYPKSKYPLFAAGTLATAGGLFFLLRSFYFVDKAGKLMDLKHSTIYLEPTQDGYIGLKWKF